MGGIGDLDLVPSTRLLALDHPAHEFRVAALEGSAEAIAVLTPGRQRLAVFRVDGDVTVEPLSFGEFAFLRGLSAGSPLDSAIATAFASEPEFSPAEAIGRLLHLGVFTAAASPNQGYRP